MENDCQLRKKYFLAIPTYGADHVFAPLSLTLWHLLTLILYAPLNFLQRHSRLDELKGKTKARLREWATSPCARMAAWNAAQICRVFSHESSSAAAKTRLLLNPLAIPGIKKSAFVICSYAHESRACLACSGGLPTDQIDLFSADDDDARLDKWKEQRNNTLGIWGPSGIPICRCKVAELVSWFRGALATDKGAEAEMGSFFAGLAKG